MSVSRLRVDAQLDAIRQTGASMDQLVIQAAEWARLHEELERVTVERDEALAMAQNLDGKWKDAFEARDRLTAERDAALALLRRLRPLTVEMSSMRSEIDALLGVDL